VFALVSTALAVALRWLLDPYLGDLLALVTLYAAVAASVWYGGYRPACLATVAGYLACDYLFIAPRGRIVIDDVPTLIGLLAYLVSCTIIVGFGHAMRSAQSTARRERRLTQITLASIGDAVITTDVDGRITYCNKVATGLTGWTLADALGQPLQRVFDIVKEETRTPVENPALRALREGSIIGLANHTLLLSRDGTERPIDDSAAPIRGDDAQIAGCVLVFRDVTQRREAERTLADRESALQRSDHQLRAFLDNSTIIAWLKDGQGRYVFLSANFEKRFGMRVADSLGKTDAELFPPGYAQEFVRNDRALLESSRGVLELVEQTLEPDGTTAHWLTNRFVYDDGNGSRYIGGLAVEITARVHAEEALAAADRRKDEFLATLAHELRNPLAPMRSAVEILRRNSGEAASAPAVAIVALDRQLAVMERLIGDLLDISRIATRRVDLRRQILDLGMLLHDAVEASQPLARQLGHRIELRELPRGIFVDADPVRLAQVFGNLLNNACKFTPEGGQIVVAARVQDGAVRISIADSGIGIPRHMLRRIFELFMQVNAELERSSGGLGIGLTLVRQFVDLHGGSVEADSDGEGRGSTFTVTLPLAAQPQAVEIADEDSDNSDGPRWKVLIVDDNRDSAELLGVLFTQEGHDLRLAHDGLEALERAEAFAPDIVLLDIGLPKLNGYETCRRMRAQHVDVALTIVAISGWGQAEDRRRSHEAGFDAHLVKPVEYQALKALLLTLRAAVGEASAEDLAR
jgi:PAS domain S-box-containing protein